MSTMKLPQHIVWRTYGNTLAILINVRRRKMMIVRNDALADWKRIEREGLSFDAGSGSPRPFVAFIDEASAAGSSGVHCDRNMDVPSMRLIHGWAFKNHIPLSGHLELTSECNLRCRHCYCVFDKNNKVLTTTDVFRILDELERLGALGLVLTGGEIFTRPDIMDILDELARRRFVVRMNTNATLITPYMAKHLGALGNIFRMHVSLYSAEAQIHDRITRRAGSFAKTIEALHRLKEAGISLRINCSVMRSNVGVYQDVKSAIGDPLGIPVHYDSEIFPMDDGRTDNLVERISEAEFEGFWAFKTGLAVSTSAGPNETSIRRKLCRAGFSFFSICADGRVYPCLKMKRFIPALGNLNEKNFADLWHYSRSLRAIRTDLDEWMHACNTCELEF